MQNMDFWFFWNIFRKKWRYIIMVAFIAAILAGMFSRLFIKPQYISTVSLYFGRVTETSPLEKAISIASGGNVAGELGLGAQLSTDYQELLDTAVFREGIHDELARLGKEEEFYKVTSDLAQSSRIMKINIVSHDPAYSQELAQIYAQEFISKAPQLVGVQNTQIIEEPALNTVPISPNIPKNILIAFIAGFAGCFVICIGLQMLDRTIKTSTDVEDQLQIPVLGTVHQDKEYAIDKNNPLLFTGTKESESNRSRVAEDFRVFRVNLMNRKPEDRKTGSVIAVTSSHAKEGKTFCTANLGAALAEAGYKVLLVDCDPRKRGLQGYFGKSTEKGLMNILADKDPVKFEDVVKRNMNGMNMDVLFCGSQDMNSANLMISPKFKELMNSIKKDYDYAFLDVSCHLGTADIVSAGSTADSVLLLVRSGKTDSGMVKQTVESLRRANLDISGVILNGVDEE